MKKIQFGEVIQEVNLVPGEKSEGNVKIEIDAREIQSGEFMQGKIKGMVTLDDQAGFTVSSSVTFVLDCGSND